MKIHAWKIYECSSIKYEYCFFNYNLKFSLPISQLHINKATLQNYEVQIHFVNYPNEPLHKKFLGCHMLQVFYNFFPKN
jgi:hypothetical protein